MLGHALDANLPGHQFTQVILPKCALGLGSPTKLFLILDYPGIPSSDAPQTVRELPNLIQGVHSLDMPWTTGAQLDAL